MRPTKSMLVGMLLCASMAPATFAQSTPSETKTVTKQESYVCKKCGKTHVRNVVVSVTETSARFESETESSDVAPAAVETPTAVEAPAPNSTPIAKTSSIILRPGKAVINVLAELNAQRSRRGVGTLKFDPKLQIVAERRAREMASKGLKNHPPGSFAPGRYEGVGWSGGFSPQGVRACFTNDSRMKFAGAAMATGRDGVYFAVVYR